MVEKITGSTVFGKVLGLKLKLKLKIKLPKITLFQKGCLEVLLQTQRTSKIKMILINPNRIQKNKM